MVWVGLTEGMPSAILDGEEEIDGRIKSKLFKIR